MLRNILTEFDKFCMWDWVEGFYVSIIDKDSLKQMMYAWRWRKSCILRELLKIEYKSMSRVFCITKPKVFHHLFCCSQKLWSDANYSRPHESLILRIRTCAIYSRSQIPSAFSRRCPLWLNRQMKHKERNAFVAGISCILCFLSSPSSGRCKSQSKTNRSWMLK